MKRPSHSETPATQFLRRHGAEFSEHFYEYAEHGGAERGAEQLGVPEHAVVKTLVMEDERALPLIVLMHGDRMVSTKNLARQAERKRVGPCRPEIAQRHSGYQIGGTSPFGLRKPIPLYMERSILELPAIFVNGGRRGFLLQIDPRVLERLLAPVLVDVALSA